MTWHLATVIRFFQREVSVEFHHQKGIAMNWLQIALLVLNVLRGLKKADSQEEFLAMSSTTRLAANGDFLRLLWENREQILAFIMMLINMKNQPAPSAMMVSSAMSGC
jgi:hypothetical protein